MGTARLYLHDASLLSFSGHLLRRHSLGGRPAWVLDRSAFYPEGGGQAGDQGVLRHAQGELRVIDTQVDDDGWVHHVLDGEPPALADGEPIEGAVAAPRRRDFTQQHTAQHLLSAALHLLAGAPTLSARLGDQSSTVDVQHASLDDRLLHAIEDRVNDVIMSNLPIRVLFPTPDELRSLPLRRDPKVAHDVRVVAVEDFDCSPCGGTHCASTGQVGPLRLSSVERHKGLFRLGFLAGRRALDDHRAKDVALRELARGLTCGPFDVGAAIEKLRAESRERAELLGQARGELMRRIAAEVLTAHPPDGAGPTRVVVAREGDELPTVRALAGELARRPDVVALVGSRQRDGGDWLVVLERGASTAFDCGAWLKETARRLGGRGGGRPERAEGRLPASVDWSAVAAS